MDSAMLCHLDAVPDGGALVIDRDPGVIVVRRGQQVWAYINRCPHFSIPLDFDPGTICTYDAEVLMCAHHSALFRFTDGSALMVRAATRGCHRWRCRLSMVGCACVSQATHDDSTGLGSAHQIPSMRSGP